MRRRTTMLNEFKTFVAQRTDELLVFRRRTGVAPFAGRARQRVSEEDTTLPGVLRAAPANPDLPDE